MNIENKYINGLNNLFVSYFELIKANSIDLALKQRIQGYIQAGEISELISREEAVKLMENIHYSVLGESIDERAYRLEELRDWFKFFGSDLNIPYVNQIKQPHIVKPEQYGFCLTSSSGIHCGVCDGCLHIR